MKFPSLWNRMVDYVQVHVVQANANNTFYSNFKKS